MNNEETTYNTNNSLPLGGSGWESIYFIGIGGIGMSAIARYFVANGKTVAGYDRTPSPITDMLLEQGVEIHFEDAVENIPSSFLDKEKTLVVYTPAIPKEHK
ncbi:MAG: UDP-N-acetylmuramate--L-alanine ligase, partial [Flavobacteriaceae bacterium]|nr:UDP-N-acetylmuramate--L-alanine ligase [Flavobacteriaceae bacterium]